MAEPFSLFKRIRRIQIQTNRYVNDLLAGAYHSAFKGRGIEFEEVREYQEGDEIKQIDWNVTARMGHPFIKNFREERELTVMLLVDVSQSTKFGTVHELKSELIAEITALLGLSAIKNEDKVGVILFSKGVEKYIPPKKGLRHVLRLIRELLIFQPKHHETDLAAALHFFGRVRRRPCICFVLSDFLCSDFEQEAILISHKHDLIFIKITDPWEITIPEKFFMHMQDLETGESVYVDADDKEISQEMKKLYNNDLKKYKTFAKKIKGGFVELINGQNYIPLLAQFFKSRKNRGK